MATPIEVSSVTSRGQGQPTRHRSAGRDATASEELSESGFRDVEDVARMGRGSPIFLRARRRGDHGWARGSPDQSGQGGRAVDAAGATGRRTAIRGVCPEATCTRVGDGCQGQQERQGGEQGGEAEHGTTRHRDGILHENRDDPAEGEPQEALKPFSVIGLLAQATWLVRHSNALLEVEP